MLLLPPQQAAGLLGLRSRGLCWLLRSTCPSQILERDFKELRTLMAHKSTTGISWPNALLLLNNIIRSMCAVAQHQPGADPTSELGCKQCLQG